MSFFGVKSCGWVYGEVSVQMYGIVDVYFSVHWLEEELKITLKCFDFLQSQLVEDFRRDGNDSYHEGLLWGCQWDMTKTSNQEIHPLQGNLARPGFWGSDFTIYKWETPKNHGFWCPDL